MAECLAEAKGTACTKCGGDDIVLRAGMEFAQAELCPHLQQCALCHGSGYRAGRDAEGYDVMRPCGRIHIVRRIQRFNAMGLPARYHTARLSQWKPTVAGEPEQLKAHAAVVRLRDRLLAAVQSDGSLAPGVRGLGLSGPPGVGKTHLLCGLASDLVTECGILVRYTDFATLLWDLKSRYDRGTGEGELLGPLLDADLLVIDEVGKGKASEWELGILDALVAGRYNRRKTTVFATNFAFAEVDPRQARARDALQRESLRDRVGDRVFSRLYEMCDLLAVGADARDATGVLNARGLR